MPIKYLLKELQVRLKFNKVTAESRFVPMNFAQGRADGTASAARAAQRDDCVHDVTTLVNSFSARNKLEVLLRH
jgi:hypothetical protein